MKGLSNALLELFSFKRGKSIVHNLDLRSRLVLTLTLIVISLIVNDVWICALMMIIALIILALTRMMGLWIRKSLMIWIIVIAILLVNGLIYSWNQAFILIFRFITFVASISTLTMTTSPDEVMAFLTSLRVNRKVMAIIMLALRFTYVLSGEATKIIDAQRVRGWGLKRRGLIKRLKPILIPLLVRAFQIVHNVAIAMDIRGFNSKTVRTSSLDVKLRRMDYLTITLSLSLLVAVIMMKFVFQCIS